MSIYDPVADIQRVRQPRSMGALVSTANTAGLNRVIIEDDGGGCNAFGFEAPAPSLPEWDYWFEAADDAKQFCSMRWGVHPDTWTETDERHA